MNKYMKKNPMQILKIDAAGCFLEVMSDSLAIGYVRINFVSYDVSKAASSRVTGNVQYYIPVLAAKVLADDIASGALRRMAKKVVESDAASGKKYHDPIYSDTRGTAAERAKREDGKALSRTLTIAPGSRKPWVVTAESGPGVPGPQGKLIVRDYKTPEVLIRVAMDEMNFRQLGVALGAAYDMWTCAESKLVEEQILEKYDEWSKKFHGGNDKSSAPAAKPDLEPLDERDFGADAFDDILDDYDDVP